MQARVSQAPATARRLTGSTGAPKQHSIRRGSGYVHDRCRKLQPMPAFIEVGTAAIVAADRGPRPRGRAPGLFWLGGFNSDMKGTKAVALDAWAAEHGRACVRFDYSGHGESGGAVRRRHHRALARGERRGVRPVLRGSAGRGRLVDGRLDGAAAGARAGQTLGPGHAGRAGADRAGARFHRGTDVEGLFAGDPPGDRDRGRLAAAVRVWRTLSDHARL